MLIHFQLGRMHRAEYFVHISLFSPSSIGQHKTQNFAKASILISTHSIRFLMEDRLNLNISIFCLNLFARWIIRIRKFSLILIFILPIQLNSLNCICLESRHTTWIWMSFYCVFYAMTLNNKFIFSGNSNELSWLSMDTDFVWKTEQLWRLM